MRRGSIGKLFGPWLAAVALAMAPAARALTTAPEASPAATQTPTGGENLKLVQDPTSRLTLAVMINGKGPFEFLVDTGSDRTVISHELATSLALPPGHKVLMHGISGADDVKTVVIDRLAVGARVISHIEAPALAASNLGAAGMLGVDALRDLHLVMDFKTMRLSTSASRAEPLDGNTILVVGRSRFGQLILANSLIRGERVLVVLDSGSQVSIGNPALLTLLTGRHAGRDPLKTTELVSVTGRRVTVELDDIAEASVGGVSIRNMPLAFAQLSIFDRFGLSRQPALLLGMDVLSLCRRVTVDLRRREATFTLN